MKIIDRLFVRLLTRLTLSRATRQGDLAADLAAAHGADLANTLADIDRLRRLLDIRIERVRAFVDDYSAEVKSLAQAEHMAMSLEAAADEWMEIQHDGADALVDYRDHDIADLKHQLDEASKTISLLRDNNAKQFNSGAAIAEELERFHAWALKLSGLQEKGNPSHATVRERVSKNFEQLTAAHNDLVLKLAAKKVRDFGAYETQQTISTWAADTFGPCTLERAALRAVEEMVEFIEILQLQGLEFLSMAKVKKSSILHDFEPYQKPQLMKEAADIVVCLYRVADLLGQNLHKEIDRVMQINRGRQWVRDGKGCGYHVKTVPADLFCEACQREGLRDPKCPTCNKLQADRATHNSGAALYQYGDVARALGKSTQEMVDAVAEATTGSFENARQVAGFAAQTPYTQQEVTESLTSRAESPAFFDDETKTLPASELARLKQRLENAERWESLLRDSLERVLRAMFGAEVAERAISDIGTDSFEGTMQAVREKVEYAKAWCDEGGGSEIATARLKDRAEAMLLREKSVRAELRSIADRIRTGFAGGEHAAADAIERVLADLP